MPDAALKMAIAGLGVMGRDHLKNALTLQQEGLVRLVGLADVEVERARQAGEGVAPEVPVFADPRALLEETRPDFVVVATPHPAHEEVTLAAAERGVHVLCEKPIAHTVGAADRMIEGCRRAGVVICYAVGKDSPAGSEICYAIAPRPEDVVVVHPHPGAFDGTELEAALRERGRDTVLVAGMAVDRGATRKLVADGETGFVVPADDPAALAAAIARLAGDPKLGRRLGARAHEVAQRRFVSWEARVAMEVELLESVAPAAPVS